MKKNCPKCGKKIDEFELCCPFCGEFFEKEIKNGEINNYHNVVDGKINKGRVQAGANEWFKKQIKKYYGNLGRAFGVCFQFMLSPIGLILALSGLFAIVYVAMIVWALLIPGVCFIQKIIYRHSEMLIRTDGAYAEEGERLGGISILNTINCLLMLFPVSIALLLVINPMMVFQYVHYGWVIGIMCCCALLVGIVAFISIKIYGKCHYNLAGYNRKSSLVRVKGYISIFGVVLSLIVMLVALFTIPGRTFSISNTREFNGLANMPYAGECDYILESDLDFEGNDSKTYGAIKTFNGIFDGNGHYIKNLNISKESVSYREANESGGTPKLMGFVLYNRGEIKNLGFKNCTFETILSGSNTNSFGILAGQNAGKIDNCFFVDTYAKYYHYHSYYSKTHNVLNCKDDFGYIVGRNAIGSRNIYVDESSHGKITNIEVRFEVRNQEFLLKKPNGGYGDDSMYILNNIFGDENISVVDEIGFIE